MADKVQSFENHAQIVPMFHYATPLQKGCCLDLAY